VYGPEELPQLWSFPVAFGVQLRVQVLALVEIAPGLSVMQLEGIQFESGELTDVVRHANNEALGRVTVASL